LFLSLIQIIQVNKDWKKFTITANLKAPVQSIYDCWAKPSGLEFWFLRSAEFKDEKGHPVSKDDYLKAGSTYAWMWHGYPDEVCEHGKVLEANGKDRFQFSFTGNCIVTIELKQLGELTICELTQDEIPDEADPLKNLHVQCSIGWTFYLANMKSMIEGGIDLRNKNVELHSHFK